MATLGLKEMGKFLWEGREKSLPSWLSANRADLFSYLPKGIFSISFKPKLAIAEFFLKMQRKIWYFTFGVDVMPLSLKNLLLSNTDIKMVPFKAR